jgi:hypothetical protein
MVSHNQQNSTNRWIGWRVALTNLTLNMVSHNEPELHQPMDWLGL